jgi:hypothetical protein
MIMGNSAMFILPPRSLQSGAFGLLRPAVARRTNHASVDQTPPSSERCSRCGGEASGPLAAKIDSPESPGLTSRLSLKLLHRPNHPTSLPALQRLAGITLARLLPLQTKILPSRPCLYFATQARAESTQSPPRHEAATTLSVAGPP